MANGYGYGGAYAWSEIGQGLREIGRILAARQERQEEEREREQAQLERERLAGAVPYGQAVEQHVADFARPNELGVQDDLETPAFRNLSAIGRAATEGAPEFAAPPPIEETVGGQPFTFQRATPVVAPSGENVLMGSDPRAKLDELRLAAAVRQETAPPAKPSYDVPPPEFLPDADEPTRILEWQEQYKAAGRDPALAGLRQARTEKIQAELADIAGGTLKPASFRDINTAIKTVTQQTARFDGDNFLGHFDDRGRPLDQGDIQRLARDLVVYGQNQPSGPGPWQGGYETEERPPSIAPELGYTPPEGVGGAVRPGVEPPVEVSPPDTLAGKLTPEETAMRADWRPGQRVPVSREEYEAAVRKYGQSVADSLFMPDDSLVSQFRLKP
jgi:hypothetical protein